MISNELMSKVLDREVLQYANGHYDFILNGITYTSYPMNIHELAHRCKEWAYQNYSIMLESAVVFNASGCKVIDNTGFCVMVVDAKTEPEAIFKACQWILDNKETECKH